MLPKRVFQIVLPCLFMCMLAACSFGTGSSTASPSATRAQTPTIAVTSSPTLAPGTVLFQANWSHGLSGWSGMQGWRIVQGLLEVNSSSSATLALPYKPVVNNYAIEFRLQVVSLQDQGGDFLFAGAKQKGKDGYQAGVLDLKKPGPFGSHPQAQAFIDPNDDMTQGCCLPIDYEPGYDWHIYRVEVQDNEVRLLVDGTQIAEASSNVTDTLSNGPLSLNSSLVVLRISSLRILAL